MYCMDGDIAGATTILEHMKQVKIFTLYTCLSPHENYDTGRTSIGTVVQFSDPDSFSPDPDPAF